MSELLGLLPQLSISLDVRILLSALVVSIAVSVAALIRNRQSLRAPVDSVADLGAIFESPASLLPHLNELRIRVTSSLIAILAASVGAAFLAGTVLDVLAEPIGGLEKLQVIEVTESIRVYFLVSLTVGIILASPYVISQLWIFVAAGLKPEERRWFYLLFPFAIILFLTGVAFAFFVMLPVAVPFLTGFLGIRTVPRLQSYVEFVTGVLVWVGLSFEMPLIVYLLAKAKIITAGMLARGWRIAVVGIAILAAVITPTPDPINMGIVALPLLALYVLSIVLALFAR